VTESGSEPEFSECETCARRGHVDGYTVTRYIRAVGANDNFEKLNARQREAACHEGGALLILAGAGTGKTNTLAHRVAHLVLRGADPQRILLLTFSRRAAIEMTRRARRIASATLPGIRIPWSGTFHAIANRLIRMHAARLRLDPAFSVLDRGDAADLLDVLRHELGFSKSEKRFPRKDTCLAIYSHRVNTQASLKDTLEGWFPWCAEWQFELNKLFKTYVERKLDNQALDYDDLLLYWHAMMDDEGLARAIGECFDHVLVDEYQDTNVLQAEILRRLRPDGRGLTVVGDDAQAIYSFRAATVDNILGFQSQYQSQKIELQENYRSTQRILDAANALIGKRLKSTCGAGDKPLYVTVADDAAQASYVVQRVLATREEGVALREQAVLFRSSHHSDALELELVRRNIPYVKYGGLKFLEAAHVKDLLAVLRWADNPKNRIAAFRALQILPGVGPAKAERLFASPEKSDPAFWSLLLYLRDEKHPWAGQVQRVREWYEPHLERIYDQAMVRKGDLEQLEKVALNFQDRQSFLSDLALDPPSATGDLAGPPLLDEDYLILSTVHSAKGQEWHSVHVLNVADGSFPSEFSAGRAELLEEERRLLYVAMTRARRELHLIAPLKYYVTQQSRMGDRHVYGARSRFMTREVLEKVEPVAFDPQPAVDVGARLRSMW
jgi:DNA helicase II / ATP-dependent DNA helicase PcrA